MLGYNAITKSNIFFTCALIGEINSHSWAPECAVFNHEIQYFIIQEQAMLETVNAALYSIISAATPIGVGWREMERMVNYGMLPIDVIHSATVMGAKLLRKNDELGQIKEGYFADIIAVDGNPDENIKAFRSIDFVMVNGNIVKND
jgi:hypothetical protein